MVWLDDHVGPAYSMQFLYSSHCADDREPSLRQLLPTVFRLSDPLRSVRNYLVSGVNYRPCLDKE